MLGLRNEVALHVTIVMLLTISVFAVLRFFVLQKNVLFGKEHGRRHTRGRSLWIWLLPCFVCAGFWRSCAVRNQCEQELALGLDNMDVILSGEVLRRELREDGSYQVILKEVSGSCEEKTWNLKQLQVYLDTTENTENTNGFEQQKAPLIGTRLSVSGTMQAFAQARNPGEFDYRLYARSKKLNYRMFAEEYKVIETEVRFWREAITCFREWAGNLLEQMAAPQDYGVYCAALLGDSSRMDETLYRLYQENGTAHLLAVSGLHLSLVSAACYGLLRKCGAGYGISGIAGTAVLMLYAVLTGESASVLRAGVMSVCGFLAAYLGRTYDLMSAWSLALLLLLWDSPYRLLQSGVQLSFGALVGIGWLAPRLSAGFRYGAFPTEKERQKKRSCWYIYRLRQTLIVSLSMQLVTLPMLLYHYFQYPVYGILLNFLMVPLMGIVVASGAVGIACGAVSLSFGRFALVSGHVVLKWYELCCQTASCLPVHVVLAGRPEAWKIGVYYGILFSAVMGLPTRLDEQMAANRNDVRPSAGSLTAGVMLSAFAVLLMFVKIPVQGLRITFLDVGQGDGICIQCGTKTLLVDGGSTDQKRLGEYRLTPFLHSQGISVLDYAIVSHGDADHISGLQYLLESGEVRIKNLILPAPGQGMDVYENLAELVRGQGNQVYWLSRAQQLRIPASWGIRELRFTCLSPDKNMRTDDRNEHSLVLKLDYGGFHLLLTGDMTAENEQELLEIFDEAVLHEIQVLKVAHHGSDTASSEKWLKTVQPRWAVLSYGEGNRYGHPKSSVVERLRRQQVQIFETAKGGAVLLKTDGVRVRWRTVLKN